MSAHREWAMSKYVQGGISKWNFKPTVHDGCLNWSCHDCGYVMCFGGGPELARVKKAALVKGRAVLCYSCTENYNLAVKVSKGEAVPIKFERLSTKKCLFCARTFFTETEYVLGVCTFCHESLKVSFEKRSLEQKLPTKLSEFKKWLVPGPPPFSDFPVCSCNTCRHAGVSFDNEAH